MKVVKRPVVLSFRFAPGNETVLSLEGPVVSNHQDAILTGTRGERWVIERHKFEASYDFDEASGLCRKQSIVVDAEKVDVPFEVIAGWSAVPISGKAGDYRLTYGPGDFGAVDAEIFAETYDIVDPVALVSTANDMVFGMPRRMRA